MSLRSLPLGSQGWLGCLLNVVFRVTRPRNRRLHLAEVLALGERRFVALLECDERKFLVGSTSQSITLLTEIGGPGVPHRSIGSSRSERERMQ